MEPRDSIRAADADREAVAERLRLAVDEGRLTLFEYDERLQGAYQAQTYGDLDRLLADLPGPVPSRYAQVVPAGPAAAAGAAPAMDRQAVRRAWLAAMWGAWVRAVVICTVIWGVTSIGAGPHYFWPIWVAGPWGAVLLIQTASGLSGGEPERWAARRAARQARRAAGHTGTDHSFGHPDAGRD
jgi:hypothetical protein